MLGLRSNKTQQIQQQKRPGGGGGSGGGGLDQIPQSPRSVEEESEYQGGSFEKKSRDDSTTDALRDAGDASADGTQNSSSSTKRQKESEERQMEQKNKLLQRTKTVSMLKAKQQKSFLEKSLLERCRRKIWSFLEEPETVSAQMFFQFRSVLYFTSAVLPLFGRHSVGRAAAVGEPLDDVLNGILLFEVFVRLVACPNPKHFLSDPYHIFDCLACFPFIVRLACVGSSHSACVSNPGSFYSFIGCLRPILRMLKVTRHIGGFTLLSEVLKRSAEGLGVPVFLMCLLVTFFAATIYWVEEEEGSFQSVPEVVWYCVVTISTVGYGDVSPTTTGGRFLGCLLILTGLAAFAMPLGVISGNFSAVYEDKDEILLMRRVQRRLKSSGIGPEKIVDALQSIDSSGDGKLDYMEFSGLLMGLDVGFSEDNSRALFDFFDDDKSGSLDYGEFLEKVFPGCDYNSNGGSTPSGSTASLGGGNNASLGDVLRCVNDVQSRLQKMNLSLETLSSNTESRLGSLERRVNKFKVGMGFPEDAPEPEDPVPTSSMKTALAAFGSSPLAKTAKKLPTPQDGDLDVVAPQPPPYSSSPNPPPKSPEPPQEGWAEGEISAPASPMGQHLVDLETADLNAVQHLVDEVEKDLERNTRRPPKDVSPPKAPSTPAPALPGSLESDSSAEAGS